MAPVRGIVRKPDPLGRLVLPRALLRLTDISAGDLLEVLLEGDRIVLRKRQSGCVFCGKEDNLILHRHHKVCRDCVRALARNLQAS